MALEILERLAPLTMESMSQDPKLVCSGCEVILVSQADGREVELLLLSESARHWKPKPFSH